MYKVVNLLISIGFILIMIGVIYEKNEMINKIEELNNRIDQLSIKNIQCEEENKNLWDNYYMNSTNYEGYVYYE